jgi:hypothetical protein
MAQLPATRPLAPDPQQGRPRYEGAWARTQLFEREGVERFTVETGPDPEHRRPGAGDPNPSWDAPVYADAGQFATDIVPGGVMSEALEPPPPVTLLDQTTPGHQAGYVGDAYSQPLTLQAAHEVDEGAHVKNRYFTDAFELWNEHYYDAWQDGSPAPAIVERAQGPYGRGINSAPMNNTGNERDRPGRTGVAWRPGRYQWHNVNRDFSPPRRAHGFRWVRPDVVTHIGDAPPPAKPDQYSSPFSSLQRFRTDIKSRPMLRRVPAPFDEDLIYDGSAAVPQAPVGYDGFGLVL